MSRPLKLYSWTGFYPRWFGPGNLRRNCTFFMAAPSKAAVYRATGKKAHDFYEVVESGNAQAKEIALADPGSLFFWDEFNHAPRERVAVLVRDDLTEQR